MSLDNAHFRRRFKRVVQARCPGQKALKYLAATDELPNEPRLLYFLPDGPRKEKLKFIVNHLGKYQTTRRSVEIESCNLPIKEKASLAVIR